jgi:hypothetical protein
VSLRGNCDAEDKFGGGLRYRFSHVSSVGPSSGMPKNEQSKDSGGALLESFGGEARHHLCRGGPMRQGNTASMCRKLRVWNVPRYV